MEAIPVREEVHSQNRSEVFKKWVAKLLGYSFEVVYKPGLENKAVEECLLQFI